MRGNEDYDDADDEEEDENDDEAQKCGCNQCTSVLHNVIHHKSNEETTAQMFCDKATSNYVIASNSAFLSVRYFYNCFIFCVPGYLFNWWFNRM